MRWGNRAKGGKALQEDGANGDLPCLGAIFCRSVQKGGESGGSPSRIGGRLRGDAENWEGREGGQR